MIPIPLERQRSISKFLVEEMFRNPQIIRELTECLQYKNQPTNLNITATGLYWNHSNNKYHISFHPGGSMTPAGATHIKYDVRNNYDILIRTVNFPIHVYDMTQRDRPVTNNNVMRIGEDIEIDLTFLYQIPGEQQNDVLYLLGEIGKCLYHALINFLHSRDRMMWGGKRKTRKTRKTREKKKKKTLRNKKR